MTITVDALPGGDVVVGIREVWLAEDDTEKVTTISWTMPAENAEEMGMLLLDRARSSKETS